MNIFKILASGDGSINEPNVSAFLGYLLNPKGDHGIGDELLKQIVHHLHSKNKESSLKDFLVNKSGAVRDLSIGSNLDIEVLLEQAFKKQGEKKEIVDIVILCFEKNNEKRETLVKKILSNDHRGTLKQVFLIENKIKDDSTREGQLTRQCLSTITTLAEELGEKEKEIKKMLSAIFISPDADRSNEEYEEFRKDLSTKDIPKIQFHWTKDDDTEAENTMIYFLRQIIENESKGIIEAINEQTKFIIKSFIGFVDSDFKSSTEEELEGKKSRKNYLKPIIDYISEICAKLDPDQEYYSVDKIKTDLKNLVKEKSGENLDKMTMDCQIWVSIVNEKKRSHFFVSSPSDERKNLFYYVDEDKKDNVKKFHDERAIKDNPNIYWKQDGEIVHKKLSELK